MVARNPRYNVRIVYAYDKVNVGVSKSVLVNFDAMQMIVSAFDTIHSEEFVRQIRNMPRNRSFDIKAKAMDDNGDMYVKCLKIERN